MKIYAHKKAPLNPEYSNSEFERVNMNFSCENISIISYQSLKFASTYSKTEVTTTLFKLLYHIRNSELKIIVTKKGNENYAKVYSRYRTKFKTHHFKRFNRQIKLSKEGLQPKVNVVADVKSLFNKRRGIFLRYSHFQIS